MSMCSFVFTYGATICESYSYYGFAILLLFYYVVSGLLLGVRSSIVMFEGKRGGSWCRTQVVRSPYFIIFLDLDAKTNGIFDFVASYDAPKIVSLLCFFLLVAPNAVRRMAFLTIITNDFRHNCLYLQMNCRN